MDSVPAQASSVLHSKSLNVAYFLDKDKASHKRAGLRTSRKHNDHRLDVAFQSPLLRCVKYDLTILLKVVFDFLSELMNYDTECENSA